MGFDILISNNNAKKILKNEIKKKKTSGTYLFYGRKGADLKEFALAFSKALLCEEDEFEFCNNCRVCRNIEKQVYPDIHYIEPIETDSISISQIREMISQAVESGYEGRKKVFIITDVNRLRKETANSLLKIIEEPPKDTYFILLSYSLNVLPTILSRCIPVKIDVPAMSELNISEEVYDFFMGDSEDIKEYLKGSYDLDMEISYEQLGEIIKSYLETKDLAYKIELIKALRDLTVNIKFLSELDLLALADELDISIGKNREFLKYILYVIIVKLKNIKKTEKLLEIKEGIGFNINTSLALYNFMLNLTL